MSDDRLGPRDLIALVAFSVIIFTVMVLIARDHDQRLDVLEALLTPTPTATKEAP